MSNELLGATGFESMDLGEGHKPVDPKTNLNNTTLQQEALTSHPVEKKEKPVATENNDFESLYNTVKNYKEGDTISGMVSRIVGNSIYVDIAYKAEGIVEPEEISNKYNVKASDVCKPGDMISVKIMRLENKAGNPILSKKRADYELAWQKINNAGKNNEDIQVYVHAVRDGGLTVDIDGIPGYIPHNQFDKEDLNKMDSMVGKHIYVKVMKSLRNRKKLMLSYKGSREKTLKLVQEAMKKIKSGDILKGTVRSIKSFGAFVDLGEFDGLIHISELSWTRVEKVEDKLTEGQEIEVYVLGIDESSSRISLSLKKLEKDPWEDIESRYKVGDTVTVTVTRLAQFGAFAEIEPGIEGLIHITEMSDDKQIKNAEEAVTAGQKYEARVLRLESKNKRIGLTLKKYSPIEATVPEAAEIATE